MPDKKRPRALRIVAPVAFDVEDSRVRADVLRFLAELRNGFSSTNEVALVIDFRHTERFVSGGTLLFYAELCRLVDFSEARVRVRCAAPKSRLACQVLQQIGVYEICKHPYRVRTTHPDVIHWRVARGHQSDAHQYAGTIEPYDGLLAEPLANGVYRGLAEAMANAVEHAYINIRGDGLEYSGTSDWWVFSQVNKGHLSVALCDLGIGIPNTLPITQPGFWERLKAMCGLNAKDSEYISAAIEESRSRTELRERGKGLGNIIDAVDGALGGIAMVFSNRGCCTFENGGQRSRDYSDSILGTLIVWRVPLTKAIDHEN